MREFDKSNLPYLKLIKSKSLGIASSAQLEPCSITKLSYYLMVALGCGLALIAAVILVCSLGCGGLARGGRSNVGTPLALATALVSRQDMSEKQEIAAYYSLGFEYF